MKQNAPVKRRKPFYGGGFRYDSTSFVTTMFGQ